MGFDYTWDSDRGFRTYWVELYKFSSSYRDNEIDIRVRGAVKGYCGNFYRYYTRYNHNVAVF